VSERVPAGGPYRAAVGLHDRLTLEHLQEARRLLSSYCSSGMDYCCRVLRLLGMMSPLVARARLEDLSRNSSYEGLDKGIIDLYRRLERFYSDYVTGVLLEYGEDVIVIIKRLVEIDGVVLVPGEYVRLPPGEAASLFLAGLAMPGEATAIKIGRLCSRREGAGRSEVPEKD